MLKIAMTPPLPNIHQGRIGEAFVLGIWVDGQRQVAPVDQIVAHRVAPVLTCVFRRIGLIEQVPASLPEAEAIGVVQAPLGVDVMIDRAMRIVSLSGSRRDHCCSKGLALSSASCSSSVSEKVY